MPPTRAQILGQAGERLAREHYERLGYRVLDSNYRTREGELDLVVGDARCIVFVEVKTCRRGGMDPFEAIDERKRMRLRRLATVWLLSTPNRPGGRELRFDAVGVVIDSRGHLVSLEQREAVL